MNCIWYCITGSSIEEKEIEIMNKLIKEFNGLIPLIIVYTRMISKSNFNNMKNQINKKLSNIDLIHLLAEDVIISEEMNVGNENEINIIKSFWIGGIETKNFRII